MIQKQLIEDYKKLYRLAYSYVHNESDALDIVQETAYKALKNSRALKEPKYAGTWIYRIAINESINFLRKHKRQVDLYEEVSVEVEDRYLDVDLHRALNDLDPLDKAVVVLRFFEGMQLKQIAMTLDENVNTVKSRLYRSLKKLKITLDGEGADFA